MKMPILAVLKLSGMSSTEKITKAEYIAQQWELYGKEFPATAPNTPAERTKVALALSQAHAAAQDGSRLAKAQEKAAIVEFDLLFGAYRDWANQPDVAQGDEIRIAQLGLDISRQNARRADRVGTPDLQPLTGTNEGELIAACSSMLDAKAYIAFVAFGDEMPADDDYRYCTCCTKPKMTLTLPSGKMAWVRLLAVGTHGPSPLSAPQKRRVL